MSYSRKEDLDIERYKSEIQYIYNTSDKLFNVYFKGFSILLNLKELYDRYFSGYTNEIIESILIYIHHYSKLKYVEPYEEIKKNCIILYYCTFLKNIIENKYVNCKSSHKTDMITIKKTNYQEYNINNLFELSNNAWKLYLKTHKKIYLEEIYWYTRYIIQKLQNWNTSQIVSILNACHVNLKKCYNNICKDKVYHMSIKEGGNRIKRK
jgi:hypothetical protein